MTETTAIPPEYRRRANDAAVDTFATGYISSRRAARLKTRLTVLKFVGLAIPVVFFGIIAAVASNAGAVAFLVTGAGILGTGQIVLNLWSLVADWERNYAIAHSSRIENNSLYETYRNLANTTQLQPPEFVRQLENLDFARNKREQADAELHITEEENRTGMRAALREMQRPCAHCKKVPGSMEPTDCPVCGNFTVRRA